MFDNGSFLRRRKRFKRMNHSNCFPHSGPASLPPATPSMSYVFAATRRYFPLMPTLPLPVPFVMPRLNSVEQRTSMKNSFTIDHLIGNTSTKASSSTRTPVLT